MLQFVVRTPKAFSDLPDPIRATYNLLLNGFAVRELFQDQDIYAEHMSALYQRGFKLELSELKAPLVDKDIAKDLPYPFSLTMVVWLRGAIPELMFTRKYFRAHRRFVLDECGVDIAIPAFVQCRGSKPHFHCVQFH